MTVWKNCGKVMGRRENTWRDRGEDGTLDENEWTGEKISEK